VSPAEWNKASKKLLAKEKTATRARDKLAAEPRQPKRKRWIVGEA
jgi:predicted dithiol-disulfide oxidoreductase (DUF899 family)